MTLKELVGGLQDASTVKRVFGDPIERDGALVIPVASLVGGFGGGQGPTAGPKADAAENQVSWGGGGGWSASPAGVYVVKDGTTSWYPAVNANRTILFGMLTGMVALLVFRSIVRTLAKRN